MMRSSLARAQMMRWTPPGDLNGIEVPKSSRCVITNQTGGIRREEYNYSFRPGKIRFRNRDLRPSGTRCYLGLTPSEHSSGLRRRLGRISKQGDVYLRTLLIHGARAVLVAAQRKPNPDRFFAWALQLQRRCGNNKAT